MKRGILPIISTEWLLTWNHQATKVLVSMPRVGSLPPVSYMDEDTEAVRSTVLRELENGRYAVLHAHSRAVIPVNNALTGPSKSKRSKDGKCGVIKLNFACSFVIPESVSLAHATGGGSGDPEWRIKDGVCINTARTHPLATYFHHPHPSTLLPLS
ncbi:hypothetical protein BJ878DRAFT_265464 [Calycina marina]|uniref:Uncharacterized protein n=1 Tax=Calycina marina TaxID=1763456 RepID=A0A9P7ZBK2_9HELO|nr:hypothetical protein BJ878DRAFT_265464 [Calycina marina]